MVPVSRSSTIRTSRETNEQPRVLVVRVGCNPVCPLIEAESCGRRVPLLVSEPGRAFRRVIELCENHIEWRLRDGIGEANVGNLALRSSGDQQVRLNDLQLVDEVAVVGGEANCAHSTHICLEIEVETVNVHLAKGPRLAGVNPCLGRRSKSSHEELCKPQSNTLVGKGVVSGRGSTTERQQDLLAVVAADLDARSDCWACLQQRRVLAGLWVREDIPPACVTEVRLGVVANMLGELCNKSEVDDLDGRIRT